MANPDGYPREAHLKFTKSGTSDTITYRENSASKLMDWSFSFNENFPRTLMAVISNFDVTTTVNLLNASCAEWSGATTGALSLGEIVTFGLYQSDASTVDVLFTGRVTDIRAGPAGTFVVVAEDYLARLDYVRRTMTYGATYRDEEIKAVTTTGALRYIGGVTEASIVEPMVRVAFAHTDERQDLTTGVAGTTQQMANAAHWEAQSFIAQSDHLIGIEYFYHTSNFDDGAGGTDLTITLHDDDGDSPGAQLDTHTETLPATSSGTLKYDLTTSSVPLRVNKGEKYWVKFQPAQTPTAGWCEIHAEGPKTAVDSYRYDVGLGDTELAANNLLISTDWAVYESLSPDNYWFDDTANRVYMPGLGDVAITTVGGAWYAINRGMVSFYYGTVTKEQIAAKLITLDTGMLGDVSTNLDRTFGTYSTRGKPAGECMRELMDVYEISGTWDTYQSVMAHYLDGSSINRCKVGKRKKSTDAATYIISHGLDTANDDEHLIIEGGVRLKQSNKMKYARVVVVGEDTDQNPLVATRSDQALTTSFWNQLDGMAETLSVFDKNLKSLVEASREGWRLLDAVQRDVWEGSILLSGQHEDMWDWTTANDTYGSGNIITLNYSPLGISATKFKVKQVVMRPRTTEIYITNVDPLLQNRLTGSMGKAERSESFFSPLGVPETVYGSSYSATVLTTASLWMELCDSGGTALTPQARVLCTKFGSTRYNMNIYHAEFEAGNGFSSTIGGVGQIKLHTAKTGGSLSLTVDLDRTVSSIVINEEVDKFRSSRLVFEVLVKAS